MRPNLGYLLMLLCKKYLPSAGRKKKKKNSSSKALWASLLAAVSPALAEMPVRATYLPRQKNSTNSRALQTYNKTTAVPFTR